MSLRALAEQGELQGPDSGWAVNFIKSLKLATVNEEALFKLIIPEQLTTARLFK